MVCTILAVIFLKITITLAAPMQLLLQQLHGFAQQQIPMQETLQQPMMHQKIPMQGVMPQEIPLQGLMQQQIPLQETMHQPMVMPMLQPLQGTVQQQRLALQEQMFALQQFQALQKMNLIPSPMALNSPVLVLFPNIEQGERQNDLTINSLKHQKPEEIGDEDSEVIDAEPQDINIKTNTMRAILLMPKTRSFIGDFISSIPFLPIEINVPDTISWIYNGIAGIISGIGQNLPFRPQTPNSETQEGNVKSTWNQMKKQMMPIVVIPL